MTETEMGRSCKPQLATDCRQSQLFVGKQEGRTLQWAFQGGHGSSTVLTSDFWPPDLRKHIPIGLSTPVCGDLSWQLEEISMTFKLPRVNPAHHFPPLPSFLQGTGMCAGAGDTETSGDCYTGCTLQPSHPSTLGQSEFLTLW